MDNVKGILIVELPRCMGIPGENFRGVLSANEFLKRNNLLMDEYDAPVKVGKKVAVIGGGNLAIEVARTALRFGSEVFMIYRRLEKELPSRIEEVNRASEEGVSFDLLLTNPVEILGDEKGRVRGIKCEKIEPGESRDKNKGIKFSEFTLDVDTVIMSLGTSPDPLISSTTNELEINKKNALL